MSCFRKVTKVLEEKNVNYSIIFPEDDLKNDSNT